MRPCLLSAAAIALVVLGVAAPAGGAPGGEDTPAPSALTLTRDALDDLWRAGVAPLLTGEASEADLRAGFEGFIAAVEDGLGFEVPSSWEDGLVNAHAARGGLVTPRWRLNPAPSVSADWRAERDGENGWLLADDQHAIALDPETFSPEGRRPLAFTREGGGVAIAPSWPPLTYPIVGFGPGGEEARWTAEVAALGEIERAWTGRGLHVVDVRLTEEHAYVFGMSGLVLYIEVFALDDGAEVMRWGYVAPGFRE